MENQPTGEQLLIQPNTLVFYIDDSGDEQLNNRQHPIFAFGGVACVGEFHTPIAQSWQTMKAATFPQVAGPLHAKKHMRDRLPEPKRLAVLAAMAPQRLARFGTIITTSTEPLDAVMPVACGTLANRFARVATGLIQLGLWRAPGRVVAVFEHSTRLVRHLERHFTDLAMIVGPYRIPVEGCFMPKAVANPFLEMADFVVNTLGKNVKLQMTQDPIGCTANFQALFRGCRPAACRLYRGGHSDRTPGLRNLALKASQRPCIIPSPVTIISAPI